MIRRTVVFPIFPDKEQGKVLEETAKLYKEAWQYCIKHRSDMGRWSFNRVEKAINYGAEMHGIYVEYVEPHYTSQMCSQCNIVLKTNRKSQSFYSCSCGLMLNADLNAARNIANKWCIANGYALGLPVNQPIVANSTPNGDCLFSYKLPTFSGE